jgi:hypothetical protein
MCAKSSANEHTLTVALLNLCANTSQMERLVVAASMIIAAMITTVAVAAAAATAGAAVL